MPAKKQSSAKKTAAKKAPAARKKGMNPLAVTNLKARAKELGVKGYSRMSREQLIWNIQEAEGNAACFGRIPDCGIADCLWRPECQPSPA
jgi:hypothetical protein